jgi:hypothetical protein
LEPVLFLYFLQTPQILLSAEPVMAAQRLLPVQLPSQQRIYHPEICPFLNLQEAVHPWAFLQQLQKVF